MTGEKSTICDIYDTEDGEEWYIVGHDHDNKTVIAELRRQYGKYADFDGMSDDEFCITRNWYRQKPDQPDEEWWEKCDPSEPGAEPFTLIEL